MVNGAPPATTALPRRRNLVRNALREIEKIVPSAQWGTVVIQPDQTVRVSRIGCANSSAAAQPASTATSTTASQSARRSVALTARQIKKNRRAADHQAALASSARLSSGAAPAADAPSADASAGGPSQSAIAAASAAPSPAEHHHHPNSVAAVFTASCDITASASAAAACASAPAARNSWPEVHFDHNRNGMVLFCTSGKFRSNVIHFAKFCETDGGGADGELAEARRVGWACRRL